MGRLIGIFVVVLAVVPLLGEPKSSKEERSKKALPLLWEENYVYIPYRDLSQVMGREMGVFVPKNFFDILLASFFRSKEKEQKKVSFGISEVTYELRAEEDVAFCKVSLGIEIPLSQWVEIPLGWKKGAMESWSASLPHYLIPRAQGYSLIIRGPGKAKVEGQLLFPLAKEKNITYLSFEGPGGARGEVKLSLPKEATFRSSSLPLREKKKGYLLFSLLPSGRVELSWFRQKKPVLPKEGQLEALLITQSYYREEGEKHRVHLFAEVFGGERDSLTIRYPKGYEFSWEEGGNLKGLEVRDRGSQREVVIRFRKKITRSYQCRFLLEKTYFQLPQKAFPPLVQVLKSRRNRMYFALYPEGELELFPKETKGWIRLNFTSISRWVKKPSPYVFFLSREKEPLSVEIRRKKPQITVVAYTLVYAGESQIGLEAKWNLKIQQAGVLFLDLALPSSLHSFQLREGEGELEVRKKEKEIQFLRILLPRKVKGFYSFTLSAFLKPPSPCALGEKAKKVLQHAKKCRRCSAWLLWKKNKTWTFPRLQLIGAKRESHFLAVATRKEFQLLEVESQGLVPEKKLLFPSPPLGFQIYATYRAISPQFLARFRLERKKAQVFWSLEGLLSLREKLWEFKGHYAVQIKNTGLSKLHLYLPAFLKRQEVRILGEEVRGVSLVDSKKGLWRVELKKPVLGTVYLSLHCAKDLGTMPLGKLFPFPSLSGYLKEGRMHPSYLAVKKEGNWYLYLVEKGLLDTDIRNLPERLRRTSPFKAYRILDKQYQLEGQALRLEYAPVVNLLVRHFHLDTVLGGQGNLHYQFFLAVQNNGRQFLPFHLPQKARSLLLEVNGRPILHPPKGRDAQEVLIPLLQKGEKPDPRQLILIRGRFEISGKKLSILGRKKIFPPYPKEVPITLFTWNLYLPKSYTYLDFGEKYISTQVVSHPLLWLREVLEGVQQDDQWEREIRKLKGEFQKLRGFFHSLTLLGREVKMYLPAASLDISPPPVSLVYVGKRTAAFLYFSLMVLTVLLSLWLGAWVSKSFVIFGGASLLLILTLFLSSALAVFTWAALLALFGTGAYWSAKTLWEKKGA